ncbi:MAG: transcriptional regulator [Lachnospiraceae bacterium]|nr:transcriptional regulator [Lachnospiraceae bacterium]
MEEKDLMKREPRSNQKLKIMYLMKVLLENTDETHSITLQQIIEKLKSYNVTCERKSIYADIEQLRQYGLDIYGEQKDRTYYYRVVNRQFELAELKLLVDSVQSAKFITAKKSNDLIKKIEGLASKYEAQQLQRQVYVASRVKTINEGILINVDAIHNAINSNTKIRFQYYRWTPDKNRELRHDGKVYEISPWALSWDDEYYYMVGYDSENAMIKHYRVDKMLSIDNTELRREGRQRFQSFDMAEYAKKMFGMFDADEETVKILCDNRFAGVMIDRFGKDVRMLRVDEEHFTVDVKVAVSKHFLGWIMALGNGVKIVGPDKVVDMMKEELKRLMDQYEVE